MTKEQEIEKIVEILKCGEKCPTPDVDCEFCHAQALYDAGYRNVNDMKLTSEEVTNLVWRDSPIGYKVAQAQLYLDIK